MTGSEERTSGSRGWDFWLMMTTVGLLGALGLQSFVGTLYAWWAYRNVRGFEQVGYGAFVSVMNAIAAPLVIALVVVLGLCVPKRILSRDALLWTSATMVGLGLLGWLVTGDAATGLALYLVAAAALQLVVVFLTAKGARELDYLTEGRVTRLGSALLHLVIIVFVFVVVALQGSDLLLPVFFAGAILLVAGSAMSFWARKLVGR
jgi:hypothetical protein